MEDNFLVRLWNRIVYWLNTLLGEEPSDMLLQQQAVSYQRGIDGTYEKLLRAGGRMGETVDLLAANKAKLRQYQANLDRSALERKSLPDGSPAAEFKDQEVAMRAKMVAGLRTLVTTMETNINQSRRTQGLAKLNFQNLNMQRDLANTEAAMYVDQEAFARMQEDIASAQLAAAGITKQAGVIKDVRGELKRRASRAQGRADTATDLAASMTGFRGKTLDMDENETAVLNDALARAGIKLSETTK